MKRIAIQWRGDRRRGHVEVSNGRLRRLRVSQGTGTVSGDSFTVTSRGPCRLVITLEGSRVGAGADATVVHVCSKEHPFSFLARDVTADRPIFIPQYGVAVTEATDGRSFDEIEQAVQRLGLQTELQRMESEAEESYDTASANTRAVTCPTWLGLSRDMRIFECGFRGSPHGEMWDWVMPRFHGEVVSVPETGNEPVRYNFMFGRGFGCVHEIARRLEDGTFPILHARIPDAGILYRVTAFVALESSKLTPETLRGTHFLVADGHAAGHMFTDKQRKQYESLVAGELERDEETVLYLRVQAVNATAVPRYAWFKAPFPNRGSHTYSGRTGFGSFKSSGRVYCEAMLDGKPLPQEEIAVLVAPGTSAVFECFFPHRPISKKRARALAKQDFDTRHAECRLFWQQKLDSAARVRVPERRIDEMMRAGLLHLDLVTYGLEPAGTLAATIGVYCPIGSESSPIIQFMDSMGRHDVARRALQYFLDKQHEDGFIQNFGGYMLETGAALWSMGEHYRYTRDDAWVKRIAPKVQKSCQFLLDWRKRNKKPSLRGKGYGMIEGKVGDPEDPCRYFMLNGYAYMGLARAAEMLVAVDPAVSKRLARHARAWKRDIRVAFFERLARSPVVPLGDGTWCPTAPPWAEAAAPMSLFAEQGNWYTHGTFLARDSLVGPLYSVFQEVIEPGEDVTRQLLEYHCELLHVRNAAFSQPYYSRHPWVHLKRGEVKAFLAAYYNGLAGLADRETYTFWEHYFRASPHKTHEEGWFLMQTRWMLYMEEGATLRLLAGIPRAWMRSGQSVELEKVATYFGPLSMRVDSKTDAGSIEAVVECPSKRRPGQVELRLPHPEGIKATSATGGVYDSDTETVRIRPFKGKAKVTLRF